ncbi:MAG: sterol desaturase family protein [Bacteroidetes bacterium]|nr:sterol desaturase family protein [Bacteroidota bacterium]
MEAYGKVLLIAMPAFLILLLIETLYGKVRGFDTSRQMDTISSLTSGITNVTKSVLELTIIIGIYPFFLNYFALTKIENTFLVYFFTFIILDFNGYWIHRWSHEINLFWNLHVIHHSSEEYNLACALRQSISAFFNLFTILLLPAALLGIPQAVISIVAPLHLFAQFWYHTRHINKMGWLEKVIVTPSHHRVHHAINPEYMDKNLSPIFIIWDKLFGTFQEELKEVPPVYGVTRPARTWNPIRINFQHLRLLILDCWRTKKWSEKFLLWFKPTGYRPEDVALAYPVKKIENIYQFEKYTTRTTTLFTTWAWTQMIFLLLFISYLFGSIAYINSLNLSFIYWYGAFIFIYVFSLTELMDRNKFAISWELLKFCLGLGLIYWQQDWFGSNSFFPQASLMVTGYLLFSLVTSCWFYLKHLKEDKVLA